MKGLVARIIESSFVDGPGHRAAVFLQGCDMRCGYCHNPETRGRCDACGRCISVCPGTALSLDAGKGKIVWREQNCLRCDACVAVCPRDASPKVREYEPEELVERIRPLAPYLDGVTFSGGECTNQSEFLIAAARRLRVFTGASDRWSILADTNGGADAAVFDALLEELDGFMFDLKAPDEARHRALTGRPLAPVLRNLEAAARREKLWELRIVLLEGINDAVEEVEAAARLVDGLGSGVTLRLIPFRPQGVRGEYATRPPYSRERFTLLVEAARSILGERIATPLLD